MRLQPKDAAKQVGVTARTLHRWAREGHITRTDEGFDLAELLAYVDSRHPGALLTRAGVPKNQWPDWGGNPPSRRRVT